MIDKLMAEPGTLEFYKQLLEIAQGSDHPIDKALVPTLRKLIAEIEARDDES